MTRSRGTCPVCERQISLVGDGVIGRHGTKEPFVWPPVTCPGWRQAPKAGA